MGFIPEEYRFRREGLHAIIDMHIYFDKRPGPQETKVLPYRFSTMLLEEAFRSGGLEQLEGMLDVILADINKAIKDELMGPYREAAKEMGKPTSKFGLVGAFLEIERPDIIAKIALEGHEEGKGKRR